MAIPLDLRAQTTTATLRGQATDQQGARLPGVTITARQVDTNTSRSVISSDAGQYFLPNLAPGRYEVSAELQGFRLERRTALMLQIGQELTIDFTLKVEGVQEVVTVGAGLDPRIPAFGGPIWNVLGSYTTTLSNSSFNEARFFYGSNKAPISGQRSPHQGAWLHYPKWNGARSRS